MKFVPILSACLLASCSKGPTLPEGVALKIAPSNEAIMTLEKDRAMMVKQQGEDGRIVIISNLEGVFSVLQLEKDGSMPVSVEFLARNKAKITITRGNSYIIIDEDGDGVPEMKSDQTGNYRLKRIEWEKIKRKSASESEVKASRQ